jgi:hypothetical protein
MTSILNAVLSDGAAGLFAAASLYLATYLLFLRVLKYPRNWIRPSAESVVLVTVLVGLMLAQVSLSTDGFNTLVLFTALLFVASLFFVIAAPTMAFKPASSAIEFCARHGDYAGLWLLVPAAGLAYTFPEASRLHGLLAGAMAIEVAWFMRRRWSDRRRQLVPINAHDLAVMKTQANDDLVGFAARHGMRELAVIGDTASWRACEKTTSPCPFNLYVNRLGLNTAPCCREHMKTLSHTVSGWLEELRLDYWLEGGTLLGAVRDNGTLLAWEDDVDVSVLLEPDVAWRTLAEGIAACSARDGIFVDYFEEKGFIAIFNAEPRRAPFRWENYRLRGEVRLDLTVYRRGTSNGEGVLERRIHKGDMPATDSGGYGIAPDLVLPTSTIEFMGRQCACPRHAAGYLGVLYGDFNTIAYSYVDAQSAENRRHLDEA